MHLQFQTHIVYVQVMLHAVLQHYMILGEMKITIPNQVIKTQCRMSFVLLVIAE